MDFNIFTALLQTVIKNPASAILILPVAILAFTLEKWPQFPNKLILPMCLFNGLILFPLLTPWSSVPDTYPFPVLVLSLEGFILGFVAWIVHASLIKRLTKKFHINGDSGDTTTFYKKPEPPETPVMTPPVKVVEDPNKPK